MGNTILKCLTLICLVIVNASLASGYPVMIPKTGQNLCYDTTGNPLVSCFGTGQDADIKAGVPLPQVRFTSVADGTIADNLTGLVWVPDGALMVNRDRTFDVDDLAGDGKVTWQRAIDYIKKLNTESYLGYIDWRLPNINELSFLMDAGTSDMADWLISSGISNIAKDGYWSSTSAIRNPTYAWLFSMKTQQVAYAQKNSTYYNILAVRNGLSNNGRIKLPQTGQNFCYDDAGGRQACSGTGQDGDSRSGVPLPDSRFFPNTDGTVTDTLTGIAWAHSGNAPGPAACIPGTPKTWQDALNYTVCLNLTRYLGHDDWRLPNIKEMSSLIDYGRSDMAAYLNGSGFSDFKLDYYWTSSSVANAPHAAWLVHLSAATFIVSKTSAFQTIPVRGGNTGGAQINLTPNALDLGRAAVGTATAATQVVISNGDAAGTDLIVNSIELGGVDAAMFSIATQGPNACTSFTPVLSPGQACTLEVKFSPPSSGSKEATIRFSSNDAAQPIASVSLRAVGDFMISTTSVGSGSVVCLPGNVDSGGTTACSITSGTGYELRSLTDNGNDVTTSVSSSIYPITDIRANHNLVATFTKKQYTITGTVSGNLGTVSCVPANVVYGDSAVCSVIMNPGHILQNLYDNDANMTTSMNGSTYTLTNVAANHIIRVEVPVYLPQTGQYACYDAAGRTIPCYGTGQDGALQAGVPLPGSRYITNQDGTVTDTLTGLAWALSGNIPGPDTCSPGISKTWQDALNYVACLNTNRYLGYTDWHLPNIKEMISLLDYGHDNAAYLNSSGFTDFQNSYYWTSTSVSYAPGAAWLVHLTAATFAVMKNSEHLAIPVRNRNDGPGSAMARFAQSGQQSCYSTSGALIVCAGSGQDGGVMSGVQWPVQRFMMNPDGTVLDRLTGLNWVSDGDIVTDRDPSFDVDGTIGDGKITWQHALDYIQKLNAERYFGYSDWRLPNVNELASLVNTGVPDVAKWLNNSGFSNIANDGYWTSTSVQSNPIYSWLLYFGSQNVVYDTKVSTKRALPVRGGYFGDAIAIMSPASLDFGLIDISAVNRKELEILNSSAATTPLVIRSLSVVGINATSFTLSAGSSLPCPLGNSFTLLPETKCAIAVDFVPSIAGIHEATVRVTASGTPFPQTDLPVTGSVVDTLPPSSLITSPKNGDLVHGTSIVIDGTAFALSGVASVEVSTDGGASWNIAEGKENWRFVWSPARDGAYSLISRATNTGGVVQATQTKVTVTVDNTPPTSVFISPTNGTTVNSSAVIITGTASDEGGGLQMVEVSTDRGVTWNKAMGTSPWSYTWTVAGAGNYTVMSRATDKAGNVQATPVSISITADILRFTLSNGRLYPIIWSGESVSASVPLTQIEFYSPTFGTDRKTVNQALPNLNGATMTFISPGEYYLKLNGTYFLKVLVLSPQEPISSHVMRIFNFSVANMIQSTEDDNAYYAGQTAYLAWWFQSPAPARILCGPTAEFFNMIIKDALDLPTRKVTFPGVYRFEGQIYKSSHNILEVYLPDINKWTLFDINYGFVARWMDAFDLVNFVRQNTNPYDTSAMLVISDEVKRLDIPKDIPIPYYAMHGEEYTGMPFSPDQISNIPMTFLWKEAFRFYYSGLAYWGNETSMCSPTGTEFLPGQYIFANSQTDSILKNETISWVESSGFHVTEVTQDALASMLAAGFSAEIANKVWLQRLPQQVP